MNILFKALQKKLPKRKVLAIPTDFPALKQSQPCNNNPAQSHIVHSIKVTWFCISILFFFEADARADSLVARSTIDGRAIYRDLCAGCHGLNGKPSEKLSALLRPPPADLQNLSTKSREELRAAIEKGGQQNMLHFRGRLGDEQIEALINFLSKDLGRSRNN